MLQCRSRDFQTVYVGPIRAVLVVENELPVFQHNAGMMPRDGEVIHLDRVFRKASDRQRLVRDGVLSQHDVVELQKESCHFGLPPHKARSYQLLSTNRITRQVMLSSPPFRRAASINASHAASGLSAASRIFRICSSLTCFVSPSVVSSSRSS